MTEADCVHCNNARRTPTDCNGTSALWEPCGVCRGGDRWLFWEVTEAERLAWYASAPARPVPSQGFLDLVLVPLIALGCVLAFGWYALGFHFVKKPTDAQLFGCEKTYVNAQGEDTGECR